MTMHADLAMVNLDSSDPAPHARFYSRVLGWEGPDAAEQRQRGPCLAAADAEGREQADNEASGERQQ